MISSGTLATSIGMFDANASAYCMYQSGTAGVWCGGSYLSVPVQSGGAKSQAGALASIDTDGITISWTKGGTPDAGSAYIYLLLWR